VLLLTCLAVGSTSLVAQQRPRFDLDDFKMDRRLLHRAMTRPDSNTAEPVIVRLRPGARRGLIQRLRAQGATIKADMPVIEAVATALPPRLVRLLARDRDVLSISTDSPVRSHGVATAVSGAAENGGYTLRRTLGLDAASDTTSSVTLRQGLGGYTGAVDGGADFYSAGSAYPTSSSVWLEGFGQYPAGMLLRFDNLAGTQAGRCSSTSARVDRARPASAPTACWCHGRRRHRGSA
jgi:hypothetical protein